jgi:hypothetical protein
MFALFLEVQPDETPNYLFGREPDGTPSQPWRWEEPGPLGPWSAEATLPSAHCRLPLGRRNASKSAGLEFVFEDSADADAFSGRQRRLGTWLASRVVVCSAADAVPVNDRDGEVGHGGGEIKEGAGHGDEIEPLLHRNSLV